MQIRVPKTKWVILRWPTPGMAQAARMSTAAFEDFFFDVCTFDYGRLSEAIRPLVARMEAADRVRIIGPGDTDLAFSIKDIPVIPCAGERNIPDGECFTAPVRESVEGVMHYNTPTLYEGVSYDDVRLVFEQGRVVAATSGSNQARLQEVFDTDEGARYVGEFSLGLNPQITEPMRDILFDEKIAGSLHFTPGQAYEIADNGNRSKIHRDMVLIQRADYGGGEIWFDDELIRKDGLFVPADLEGLNPEQLLAA
jgi:aminopeptidase